MALRRIAAVGTKSACKCLKCGNIMEGLQDDQIVECSKCGQKHFVDFYNGTVSLTVVEKPDLRKRKEKSVLEILREKIKEDKLQIESEKEEIKREKEEIRKANENIERKEDQMGNLPENEKKKKVEFRKDPWEKEHEEWMEEIEKMQLMEKKREYAIMDKDLLLKVIIYKEKKIHALTKELGKR